MIGPFTSSPPIGEEKDVRASEQRPYRDCVPFESVADLLMAVRDAGDARALSFFPDGQPEVRSDLGYGELVGSILAIGDALRRLHPAPVVGYMLPSIPETQFVLWGTMAAGGCAVPLNPLLAPEHLLALVEAAGVNVLALPAASAEPRLWELLQSSSVFRKVAAIVSVGEGADNDRLPLRQLLASGDRNARPAAAQGYGAMFHTGGTTGMPKLAPLTQANILHAAWGIVQHLAVRRDDVLMSPLPMFHIGGTVVVALAAFSAGACFAIPAPAGFRHAAARQNFWRLANAASASVVLVVPTVAAALASAGRIDAELPRLRCIVTGAAVLPPAVGRRLSEMTGVTVMQMYGMTEAGGCISYSPAANPAPIDSSGLRLPFTNVRISRLSGTGLAAPGEVGAIEIRGPNVFDGYVGRRDSFTADGWFQTGDTGSIDEHGYVRLAGRTKDLIIRGGHNIDPVLIEDAVAGHSAVALAAAVGKPDPYAGEVPVLYVTAVPGCEIDPGEILDYVAARIAEAPAKPRAVYQIEVMPVTAVGKVFKPTLRADAAARAVRERLGERAVGCTGELASDGRSCVAIRPAPGVAPSVLDELLGDLSVLYRVVD